MADEYPTALELAEAGYRGYAAATGGKTFDGRDMPEWTDLPERTVTAWVAVVVAIQAETGFTIQLSEPVPGVIPHTVVHSITVTSPEGEIKQIHPQVTGTVSSVEWKP